MRQQIREGLKPSLFDAILKRITTTIHINTEPIQLFKLRF